MFKNKEARIDYWNNYGRHHLVGKKIESVRWMSDGEAKAMDWEHSRPIVIQLDDGSIVFPSQDDEGNDGGTLRGQGPKGESLVFPVNGG